MSKRTVFVGEVVENSNIQEKTIKLKTPVKILYIDDSSADREQVRKLLYKRSGAYKITETDSKEKFEYYLENEQFDIVLTDLLMNAFSGIDALNFVHEKNPDMPVIIVIGSGSEEIAVGSLKRGASDYILKKPTHLERLPFAIDSALEKTRFQKEHENIEKELQRSELRYRHLIETARDVIYFLDPNGIITLMNSAFETLTGWKRDDWIGKSFTDLIHTDDLATVQYSFKQGLNGVCMPVYEIRIKFANGEYHAGELTASPIEEDGVIKGIMGIARDVTERKELEGRMQQMQKMEEIGTLAGGIAHDFNNILGIILGHVTMLEKFKSVPANFSASIDTITKAVHRGAGVVRQILTFARKADISISPVDVNQEIRNLGKMLNETFPRMIEITSELEPDLPPIGADLNQLHQALLNLCVNARDAILDHTASGTIKLRTKKVDRSYVKKYFSDAPNNDYVKISVSDTGAGMTEQIKRRVFEPFFTTKPEGKGTGLGLAVVFGVVRSLHGYVDVESQVGKGSTFHIYLPLLSESAMALEEEKTKATNVQDGTETILIVEDEEMLSELLLMALSSKGYKIIIAENGVDGIEMFKAHQKEIALVISDIGLPKLDGWRAFQEMKKINPNVKTILASGFIEAGQRTEMLNSGVKEFVQKPYLLNEVLVKIRKILDEK